MLSTNRMSKNHENYGPDMRKQYFPQIEQAPNFIKTRGFSYFGRNALDTRKKDEPDEWYPLPSVNYCVSYQYGKQCCTRT